MKEHRCRLFVEPSGPFTADHAERELARLANPSERVDWVTPDGGCLSLIVPPTVYPPREDTSLLAEVLHEAGWPAGLEWLEIGVGSGAISVFAAQQGCKVTACDINPLAVAATTANLSKHGCTGRVHEGGPGPVCDGLLTQWGGDRLYDRVVWNLPYLPSPDEDEPHLGPLEEASLIDTDSLGLYRRFIMAVKRGELLNQHGAAYVVVSSRYDGQQACEHAWMVGLAAKVCRSRRFDDGEELFVVRLWRPFSNSLMLELETIASTNTHLLGQDSPVGTTLRVEHQTGGRGRRGRVWDNTSQAMLASWVVSAGSSEPHQTLDQVRVGGALVRLLQAISVQPDRVCLKWPNDVFVRSTEDGGWRKAAGVLFEARTQGNLTRVVLGIGLNTQPSLEKTYGSLRDIGCDASPTELHRMIHAMVASLYEHNGTASLYGGSEFASLQVLVQLGEQQLGPIIYRGEPSKISGLHSTGELWLNDGHLIGDDPEQIEWLNTEFSIEDAFSITGS